MSGIQRVESFNKPLLRANNTGYAALACLAATTASAMVKSESIRKIHKPCALITAGLVLLHTGVIFYQRFEWKRHKNKN